MSKILSAASISLLLLVSNQAQAQYSNSTTLASCSSKTSCNTGYLQFLDGAASARNVGLSVYGTILKGNGYYANRMKLIDCSGNEIYNVTKDKGNAFIGTKLLTGPGIRATINPKDFLTLATVKFVGATAAITLTPN